MEREKFEESWKDAFDKAEVSPSEAVWTNIELELEKTRGGELKRRVMFYQLVAAASVVFALAIGGAGYYINYKQAAITTLAVEQRALPDTQPPDTQPAQGRPSDADTRAANADVPSSQSAARRSDNAVNTDSQESGGSLENLMAMEASPDKPGILALPHQLNERSLPPLYEQREIALTLPSQQKPKVDPVVAMLARLEQREREMRGEEEEKKDEKNGENLWTSVGFAAGSFNSIAATSSGSPAPAFNTTMALAAPIVEKETEASGYSYSMGVNIGTRVSERWVVQGGLNYLTHSTEYTANNVVVSSAQYQQRFHPATTNDLIKAEPDLSNKIVYSAPYSVNNSMRYISIPVQAGYLLINETFGLQLNAGVATDLFLQNTIEANSPQIDKTSQSSGSDSPYRSVNLSGLFGTEVSYRFGENYRISINPGIRYPFNTIYKSELGVQSTPLTFDVGLRFRYIFH